MTETLKTEFINSNELLEFFLKRIDHIAFLTARGSNFARGQIKKNINIILKLKKDGKDLRDTDTLVNFTDIWYLLMRQAPQ
jgi:hypothetical protein